MRRLPRVQVSFRSALMLACWLSFSLTGLSLGSCQTVDQPVAGESIAIQPQPDKATLVKSLTTLFQLLEKNKPDAAAEHVVLPPNFKPEMFGELAKLSPRILGGIKRLAQDGKFGKAADLLGSKRAGSFAGRASVEVDACYGLTFETESDQAFAVAFWDGARFKMIEIEGVHELTPRDVAKPEVGAAAKSEPVAGVPDKATLIATLKTVCRLLESKDFMAASQHFVLPPNFQPEMLDGMVERQEISIVGIEQLERDATFGKAIDVFGAERGAYFAKKASVDVSQCYGYNHETETATGEVIAFWDGTRFKLARLDDVGKLASESANAE